MAESLTKPIDAAADVSFDPALIRKYDGFGPRYTSYPTADRFTDAFGAERFVNALLERVESGARQPL
jgi:oxygen-independent coproporphyrinogen-3 oxidase